LSPVDLAYDDEGDGRPLLLIHAGVCDRRMWEPQWAALTERFRTIRCDLRGFGETPLPAEHFNPADDVIGLLDALGLNRVRLVGASFGGRVALELAATWPARVRKLVLLSGEWEEVERDPELESFGEEEDRLLSAGNIDAATELNVRTWVGPEASADARSLVLAMQRQAFEIQLAAGDEADFEPREVDPAAIVAPTLVVSGGRDFRHFREVASELGDRIPEAEHVELDWAQHLPSLERPDATEDLLLDYLAT
jgi:pimeloyl-ACP methyl ester carboxylesterase